MQKPRVLVLCIGNSARSQMAEAFLRTYAGDRFEVHSASADAKGHFFPKVHTVMKKPGMDIKGQRSKDVSKYLGKLHFAHVITVCGDAEKNCPAYSGMAGPSNELRLIEHWFPLVLKMDSVTISEIEE